VPNVGAMSRPLIGEQGWKRLFQRKNNRRFAKKTMTTIASLIEYGLYAIATIVACSYNTELHFVLARLWKHIIATTLVANRQWRGDGQQNKVTIPRHPSNPVNGVSATSGGVSMHTDYSRRAVPEEEHSVVSGMTNNSSRGQQGSHHSGRMAPSSKRLQSGSYHSYQSSSPQQPSWASQHSHLSNQNSTTKSCLKRSSSMMCSNAKPPDRRRSGDNTFTVNFENQPFDGHSGASSRASSEADVDSWASDDAMTLPSDCDGRDDTEQQVELDLPREILPAAKVKRVGSIAHRSCDEESGRDNSGKENLPSTREYSKSAPTISTGTATTQLSVRKPVDSHIARDVGIRLKQKLKRHSSFEGPSVREKNREDKISRHRSQTFESSRVRSIVSAAPPLDLSPQRNRSTGSSDHSVGSSTHDDDEPVSEDPCPSRQLTRLSSLAVPTPKNRQSIAGRTGSVHRSLSSDQLGASVYCSDSPPKLIAKSKRGSVSRCLSSDQIDERMKSSSLRRSVHRASNTMMVNTDRKARPPGLQRTESLALRNSHDDAPKIPTRSNSNGSHPGLAQRTSSRSISSRALAPSRSSSSCKPSTQDQRDFCRDLNSSGTSSAQARGTSQRFVPERSGSLSGSNSQRFTLDRRPSPSTLVGSSSSGAVPPARNNSSSNHQRPGVACHASSLNLTMDRRGISNTDRQILQRVKSSRG
jgi:hypothetical protein